MLYTHKNISISNIMKTLAALLAMKRKKRSYLENYKGGGGSQLYIYLFSVVDLVGNDTFFA